MKLMTNENMKKKKITGEKQMNRASLPQEILLTPRTSHKRLLLQTAKEVMA